MSTDHYVLLGLAQVRATWFRDLGRWATATAIPCDFVKCVSPVEVEARLSSGRPFSALFVDASLPSLDRDLVDLARSNGCTVVAVDDGHGATRDWNTLGISAVLTEPVDRSAVVSVLREHARPLDQLDVDLGLTRRSVAPGAWRGRLVGVTGAAGSGTSTVARAAAQGLAADVRNAGRVLLADLALHGDQAMLHDVGDVVPGVQELVEAHRTGQPDIDQIHALTHRSDAWGYQLLAGIRRHRDWSTLRPRAFEAGLTSLRGAFNVVVADIEADLEGQDDCGSLDIEDRNLMARAVAAQADLLVVTGTAGVSGLHRMVRVIDEMLRHDVDPDRILPVVTRAPRPGRSRAELTRALAELTAPLPKGPLPTAPLFMAERRRHDDEVRDGAPVPRSLAESMAKAVRAALDRVAATPDPDTREPVAITPGTLGSWTDDGDEGLESEPRSYRPR